MKAYIMATILRCIFGQQANAETILETFDVDPYQLLAYIDQFLIKLSGAIAAEMVLKTVMGDLSGVEVEVDIDHFDDIPISYVIENPTLSMGISKKDLRDGLTKAEWHDLKVAIIVEVEGVCNSDIRRDLVYYLVNKVLVPQ